jgi:hypothetical protein
MISLTITNRSLFNVCNSSLKDLWGKKAFGLLINMHYGFDFLSKKDKYVIKYEFSRNVMIIRVFESAKIRLLKIEL